MEKLSKEDKLEIIEEALTVLYDELNNFAIRTDIPFTYVPNIVDSITKLEKLKGDLEQND